MNGTDKNIERAGRGEHTAFQTLYQQTTRELGWYCRRLTGNAADADDLMQDTYLMAWQKLDQFRDGSFPAWLRTIARNLWLNKVRREKPQLFAEELTDDIAEDELLSPSHLTEQKLIRELLLSVLEQELSPTHRMTVLLYYYDQKSVPEIAAEMECSEGTVKSRLYYARRKLREAFTERGIMLASGVPLLSPALQGSAKTAAMPAIPPVLPRSGAAKAAAKAASGAWKGKLIAGAAAVAVVGGAGGVVLHHQQTKAPKPVIEATEQVSVPRPTVPDTTAYTPPQTDAPDIADTSETAADPQPGGALQTKEFGTSENTVFFRLGVPELFRTDYEPTESELEHSVGYWKNGYVVDGRYPIRFTAQDGTGDCIIVIGRWGGPEAPQPAAFLQEELDAVQLGAFSDTEYAVDTEHWEINDSLPSTFTAERAEFTGEQDGRACTGTVIYWETAMEDRYPVVGSVYFIDFSGTRPETYAAAEQSLIITEETVNKRENVRPTVDRSKIPQALIPKN